MFIIALAYFKQREQEKILICKYVKIMFNIFPSNLGNLSPIITILLSYVQIMYIIMNRIPYIQVVFSSVMQLITNSIAHSTNLMCIMPLIMENNWFMS